MRIHRDERGQTIILVALSLPLLLGFIGIATDVGALFKDKRTLQTAADAAAVAAALNLNYGTYVTAGKAASAANGFTDGTNRVTVAINDPPTWTASNYYNKPGYVEAVVTKTESTLFLALFGHTSVTVTARAVAAIGGPGGACVFTLGYNTGSPTLNVAGTMQATQCGVVVDSNNSPPIAVTGSLTASSVGAVGSCASGCGTGITPAPVSGIIPYSDPLSFLPQYTCSGSTCSLGGSTLPCNPDPNINGTAPGPLSPGCYMGMTINNANVTLTSGTYVINGNLTLTGGGVVSGTAVTFFLYGGTLGVNSPTLNLSAPIGGTFNGILFDQSSADTNTASIIGNQNSNLQGLFYLPNATLQLSGSLTNLYSGFVAQTLTVTANLSFNNYAALPGVTSPITSVVLVE